MIYQDVPEQPYVPNAPLPTPKAFLTGDSAREFRKRVNRGTLPVRYSVEQVAQTYRAATEISYRILTWVLGMPSIPVYPQAIMLRWSDEAWWKHVADVRPELTVAVQINQLHQDWKRTREKFRLKYDCEFRVVTKTEAQRILREQLPRQKAQWESERVAILASDQSVRAA